MFSFEAAVVILQHRDVEAETLNVLELAAVAAPVCRLALKWRDARGHRGGLESHRGM